MLQRAMTPDGSWWPGVTVPDPPARLAAGETLTFRVRSPLGYALRMRLRLTEVDPGRFVAASSTGDLAGRGSIEVAAEPGVGSVVVIRWEVETRRRWMNATARVLHPAFAWAHDRVMRTGERALCAALASEVRNAVNPGESADPGHPAQ